MTNRTVVLGLGNPLVTDDRAGLAVAEALKRLLAKSPIDGVEVVMSARGGLDLIDLLSGYSRAIIVDSLAVPEPSPGRVRRLTLDEISGTARLTNAHDIGVQEAFQLARQLDIPMPQQVEIFGVEGADLTAVSEEMTPPVSSAIEPLAREIHAALISPGPSSQDPAKPD